MAVFDLLVLTVLGLSVLVSMMRGVVAEIASLITWLVALVAARVLAPTVAELAFTRVEPQVFASVLAYIVVFIATYFLLSFAQKLMTSAIQAMGLGGINKLFGALFGLLKGTFLITMVVLLCALTDLPRTEDWQRAKSAPVFEQLAMLTVPYLPAFVAGRIHYSPPSE